MATVHYTGVSIIHPVVNSRIQRTTAREIQTQRECKPYKIPLCTLMWKLYKCPTKMNVSIVSNMDPLIYSTQHSCFCYIAGTHVIIIRVLYSCINTQRLLFTVRMRHPGKTEHKGKNKHAASKSSCPRKMPFMTAWINTYDSQ